MILAWLNEQKAKVITHIDELIDILKPRQYIAPTQILEKRNENITQSVEKVSNKTDIGNAEFLLYFGSFLVSLAIFILVALGWESMSNAVKNFVLILSIFGFAGFGFIVYNHFNLKNAGHTFYALSSILFVRYRFLEFQTQQSTGI